MAETLNTVFETMSKDFAEETKSDMHSDDWKRNSGPNSNGYVALDIANLSLLANAGEVNLTASPRTPAKTLSRKGSQRGGERKAPESAVVVAAGAEKLAHLVHVSGDGEEGTLRLESTSTAKVVVGDCRYRRSAVKRPVPWLDPRRVLVFFATLSSVGTLILLYFTLFMGNIRGATDSDVR